MPRTGFGVHLVFGPWTLIIFTNALVLSFYQYIGKIILNKAGKSEAQMEMGTITMGGRPRKPPIGHGAWLEVMRKTTNIHFRINQCMNAKTKIPKISDEAAAEIADAARKAYFNHDMDKFMDEVFKHVEEIRERKRQRGEHVTAE